ncbi:MAG: UvrD-helicase domain-containing protein [Rhodobacteraceae bacterium]|nr:UvrD-helicase domain-containing protein [Paracoccaceae bacterium]
MSEHQSTETTEVTSIQLSGFLYSLINLFRVSYRRIVLTADAIILYAKVPYKFSFEDFSKEIAVRKGFGGSFLLFTRRNGSRFQVGPINYQTANSFAQSANKGWWNHFRNLLDQENKEISTLSKVYTSLKNPRRYPAACLLKSYVVRSREFNSRFPKNIPQHLIGAEKKQQIENINKLAENPTKLREKAIKSYLKNELEAKSDFFDNIGSHPLTHQQRLSVVTDEDATLVLAGAGSGKTSVITTKAIYLIEEKIREPQEILLITYGNKAAKELRERIQKKCKVQVKALTFHALGNSILKEVETNPSRPTEHADDPIKFRKLIQTILVEDVIEQPGMEAILRKWFEEFYLPYKSEWDFESLNEYYHYLSSINRYNKSGNDLRTIKGDKVRSYEELLIANWLFLNNIDYEYEPDYEFKTSPQNITYRPDFKLLESGVYIEHFGVRKKVQNGRETLTTAPYINREQYLEQMDWKRSVHKENETKLIETYSYEQSDGVLLTNLAKKLDQYVTPRPIPIEKMFEKLNELGTIDQFSEILATFLRLFKSSSLTINQCKEKVKQTNYVSRGTAFLKIFELVYESYQKRLSTNIDFEDMLLRATKHLEEGKYKSQYRHILVDEFQDIATSCGKLLLALKNQHEDARIFGVGDDWQSIYRFNGSDINLMRHFGTQFGGELDGQTGIHSSIDLANTFRSVDKIAISAQKFIRRNPIQIDKQIIPFRKTDQTSIFIVYHVKMEKEKALRESLNRIIQKSSGEETITVFLLARYNHLIPKNFEELKGISSNIKLEFMTIHKSKGLEADHVILLEAFSGKWGFPSEIEDDQLLDIVLPESEGFSHAEERRLFYVAMTRAKLSLTLLADQKNPSTFIRELEHSDYDAAILGETGSSSKMCGKCGGRMILGTNTGPGLQFECENDNFCDGKLKPCQQCKSDLPIVDKIAKGQMKCSCGAIYPSCPACTEGWLVKRKGPYGEFYSCIRFPDCKGKSKQTTKRARRLI